MKKKIKNIATSWKNNVSALGKKLFQFPSTEQQPPWYNFYDSDVPPFIDIPSKPITWFFKQACVNSPQNDAVIYFGRKISYKNLDQLISKFANGLVSLGVKKGDRVALVLPNIPQFLIAYWAALSIGAIVTPLNPMQSRQELLNNFKISGAKVAIILDRLYEKIIDFCNETELNHVIVAFVETYMPSYVQIPVAIRNLLEQNQQKIGKDQRTLFFRELLLSESENHKVKVDSNDSAVMLFTGGVTGEPKGALLTHKNLVANALQAKAWLADFSDGNEVILAALPFLHSYGMTACHHLAVLGQSTMILHPRFDPQRIINDLKKRNITIFPGVPTMYSALLQKMQSKTIRFDSLRYCISGGAPLPQQLKNEFEKLTNSRLVEGYGLTEASPITHCNPLRGINKPGSIGTPWPSTQARIVDIKSNKVLGVENLGLLQVKGPQVMAGYWQNDVATRLVIDKDGWLTTGDIAKFDKDGYFYIIDRQKEMIIRGGNNIFPQEIEKVLVEHPDITDAAVIGQPDSYYGEKITAFIMLKNGVINNTEKFYEFCTERLANFKIPDEFNVVQSLPKNFLGKIVKRKINRD